MQCRIAPVSRQAASKVLYSPTRRPSAATADRYTAIHTFFTLQARLERQTGQRHAAFHLQARLYSSDAKEGAKGVPNTHPERPHHESYSPFYRRLASLLPHSPTGRYTKDDLLKVADGFWDRTRIRLKWLASRSFRPFSADDISAFVTWFLMSHAVWVLVGTTTFFSVVFATVNSLRLQEFVARALSDYLTSETGITITFESAIVPKWKDSRISFKNVYISRNSDPDKPPSTKESIIELHVDSIDVTLNLMRWLDSKGLVQDAIVEGVRGVMDRRLLDFDPTLTPEMFRHPESPGSFHLTSLQLTDVLVTVFQPRHRPFTVSIFNGSFNTLRRQWLFYDLVSEGNGMVGMYDGCLFSLHRPQMVDSSMNKSRYGGKMARLRVDGVNISHIQPQTEPSTTSPISWIRSGKVDAVLDFHFPPEPSDEVDFNAILSDIATNISDVANGRMIVKHDESGRVSGQKELARPALEAPEDRSTSSLFAPGDKSDRDKAESVQVDIDLRFRDVKAYVPLFQNELSYTSSALIRPIVAFMNANRTLIPIRCRVTKDLENFNGAWTMWETGLMGDISVKVYDALAYHVAQANMNQRLRTVSLWSLQVTANSMISIFRNILDPITAQIREMYVPQGAWQ